MTDLFYSSFDVMHGLKWPTDALVPPNNIIKVGNEHEYAVAVAHLAPGTLDEVGEREQVPDTGQLPPLDPLVDLARALENFQNLDRIRFGVFSRDISRERAIIYELAEDCLSEDASYPSDDESTEGLPAGDSLNPSILRDLGMEGVPL